jgi:hypothetical protein
MWPRTGRWPRHRDPGWTGRPDNPGTPWCRRSCRRRRCRRGVGPRRHRLGLERRLAALLAPVGGRFTGHDTADVVLEADDVPRLAALVTRCTGGLDLDVALIAAPPHAREVDRDVPGRGPDDLKRTAVADRHRPGGGRSPVDGQLGPAAVRAHRRDRGAVELAEVDADRRVRHRRRERLEGRPSVVQSQDLAVGPVIAGLAGVAEGPPLAQTHAVARAVTRDLQGRGTLGRRGRAGSHPGSGPGPGFGFGPGSAFGPGSGFGLGRGAAEGRRRQDGPGGGASRTTGPHRAVGHRPRGRGGRRREGQRRRHGHRHGHRKQAGHGQAGHGQAGHG